MLRGPAGTVRTMAGHGPWRAGRGRMRHCVALRAVAVLGARGCGAMDDQFERMSMRVKKSAFRFRSGGPVCVFFGNQTLETGWLEAEFLRGDWKQAGWPRGAVSNTQSSTVAPVGGAG